MNLKKLARKRMVRMSFLKMSMSERPAKLYHDLEEFMNDFGFKLRDSIAYQSAAYAMKLHNEGVAEMQGGSAAVEEGSNPAVGTEEWPATSLEELDF